jgi:hypothetical protein
MSRDARWSRGLVSVLAGLVVAAGPIALSACGGDAAPAAVKPLSTIPGPYDFDYTIPLGTSQRIGRGEQVTVMPEMLDAKLGQTIRIVNLDQVGHEVGTWYVLAGMTLTYRFTAAGTFSGTCSTHSSGTFTLNVTA